MVKDVKWLSRSIGDEDNIDGDDFEVDHESQGTSCPSREGKAKERELSLGRGVGMQRSRLGMSTQESVEHQNGANLSPGTAGEYKMLRPRKPGVG